MAPVHPALVASDATRNRAPELLMYCSQLICTSEGGEVTSLKGGVSACLEKGPLGTKPGRGLPPLGTSWQITKRAGGLTSNPQQQLFTIVTWP